MLISGPMIFRVDIKKCPLLRTQSDNDDQCLPMKSFEGLEMNSAIGSVENSRASRGTGVRPRVVLLTSISAILLLMCIIVWYIVWGSDADNLCLLHCVCICLYIYVYIYMYIYIYILLDVPNFLHYLAYNRINYGCSSSSANPKPLSNWKANWELSAHLFQSQMQTWQSKRTEVWISSDTGILPPKIVV